MVWWIEGQWPQHCNGGCLSGVTKTFASETKIQCCIFLTSFSTSPPILRLHHVTHMQQQPQLSDKYYLRFLEIETGQLTNFDHGIQCHGSRRLNRFIIRFQCVDEGQIVIFLDDNTPELVWKGLVLCSKLKRGLTMINVCSNKIGARAHNTCPIGGNKRQNWGNKLAQVISDQSCEQK